MNKISKLAQLFAEYKIYPQNRYDDKAPAKIFQEKFPENYYSKDLETFLFYQNYEPTQRGADLPWWGRDFFSERQGCRVMIISQDTAVKDAGSITLEAQFFSCQFDKINTDIDKNRRRKIREQLSKWGINVNFLYITDASKIFKNGSWKDRDFDREKSKKLLESEIEFCNPDVVIILGSQPLKLLFENQEYGVAVEAGKTILIKNINCVVVPYFFGNGPVGNRGGKGFKERLKIATNLIKICQEMVGK